MRVTNSCCWRAAMVLGFCAGPMALLAARPAAHGDLPPAASDPVPIRRVLIAPERVPAEMERVQQGVLVPLSRQDFEAQVRRARDGQEMLKNRPRLLESRYRAAVVNDALVGSGQWKIQAQTPGILPLQPFNIAVLKARLQKADFDTTEAILGDLEGKTLGLLVERPGEQTALVDWTTRGDPRPEGLHFSLQLPPCPLAALELNLRPGEVVAPRDGCLVSGPHAGETAEQRLWRIDFGGRSQIDLEIRRPRAAKEPAPLVLAHLQARQVLEPNLVQADFDFSLEAPHDSVRELLFEFDPVLRPYEVSVRGLEGWETRSGRTQGAPPLLAVRLREPLQHGSVQVRCLAPLATSKRWTSPGMQLLGAVLRSENLLLQVHPEVRLESWQPGRFRLARAAPADLSSDKLAEGWQMLALKNQDFGKAELQRPSAVIKTLGSNWRVRQWTWWQMGPAGASLNVHIGCEVARGRLFRLPFLLPPGWAVERVDSNPGGLVRSWAELRENGRSTLVIDLQHPLEPAAAGASQALPLFIVQLYPARQVGQPARIAGTTKELSLPFPDLLPLGAGFREGALAISVDPAYQATAESPQPAAAGVLTWQNLPWAGQTPNFLYAYRMLGSDQALEQSVPGTLHIRPRRARFAVRCTNKVLFDAKPPAVAVQLLLRPEAGSLDFIDLFVSAPVILPGSDRLGAAESAARLAPMAARSPLETVSLLAVPPPKPSWIWRTGGSQSRQLKAERLMELETMLPLSVLAGQSPVPAAAMAAALPSGEWWRLHFPQPVREPLTLQTELLPRVFRVEDKQLPKETGAWRCIVPLVSLPAADPMEGEITVDWGGMAAGVVESAAGLGETAPGSRGARLSWRSFQYGRPPLALKLSGRVSGAKAAGKELVAHAELTTFVPPDGPLVHRFSFEMWNWSQWTVSVRLPTGARPLAASIDGRWAARLEPSRLAANAIDLPVTAGKGPHRFDILYSTDWHAWKLWTRLAAPAPELPVTPPALRRIWRLPPGISPVNENNYRRLPGPERGDDEANLVFALPWLAFPFSPAPDWREQQRRLLANAGMALAKERQKEGTLGQLLDRLVREYIKDQGAVVVDATALRDAGLTPATPLAAAAATTSTGDSAWPWQLLGVVYVPCRPAAVLTTRRQLETWQAAARSDAVSPSIEEAVADAVVHGHDASGRFRTVGAWLEAEASDPVLESTDGEAHTSEQRRLTAAVAMSDDLSGGWVSWEANAGVEPGVTLLVTRSGIMPVLGLGLALVLVVTAWRMRQYAGPVRLALILAWLAVSGLALLWLPKPLRELAWWPAAASAGVAAVSYFRWLTFRPRKSGLPASATAVLVLASLFGLAGQAAGPLAATVFLLPGAPDKQTVLAPPELLEQLRDLASGGMPALRKAVLLSARYAGNVTEDAADFNVEFHAHCFGDQPAVLMLPLGSVRVREVLVDGVAGHPESVPPPREGYNLTLKGRGPHRVLVRFRVPVQGSGEERSVRFTIPDLVQSRLTLEVPAGAHYEVRYLNAVAGRGVQRVSAAPRAGASGLWHLEAELGPVSSVHVNWRQEPLPAAPPAIDVREAYLWDLRASASSLFAVLQYKVQRGAAATFAVDLPDLLEVRSVEASQLPETGTVSGVVQQAAKNERPDPGQLAPRLKDWHTSATGGRRRLHLEFQRPVNSGVQVSLELVPRLPLGTSAVLPVPVALGHGPPGQSQESLLAYRVEGRTAHVAETLRLRGVQPQGFRQFWQAAGMADPGPDTNAFAFQRGSGGPPLLRLTLSPPQTLSACMQDLLWRIGSRRAELTATAKLTAAGRNLVFVEWDVPESMTVAEVSGPDIRSWARTGPRLQVWLRRPAVETTLRLTGWLPLEESREAAGSRAEKRSIFRLAPLRVIGDPSHLTLVRLAADSGLALSAQSLKHLSPAPEARGPNGEHAYSAKQADYGAVFLVQPASTRAAARLLTLVETQEDLLTFTTSVDYEVNGGELRTIRVRLRNWQGGQVRLEGARIAARRESREDAAQKPQVRVWIVDLEPGVTNRYRLKVLGSRSWSSGAGVPMPDVQVEGVTRAERWLAVAGQELKAEDPRGLTPVADRARLLKQWPAEAERLGRVGPAWKVGAADWHLRLVRRELAGGSRSVRLFLSEQAASVAGLHWRHQATYWLYDETGSALQVTLPSGARLLRASVDGTVLPAPGPRPEPEPSAEPRVGAAMGPVVEPPVEPAVVWLPLSGAWGPHKVALSWAFETGSESLERPNLEPPRLPGLNESDRSHPAAWSVQVPPGYDAELKPQPASGMAPAGRSDLYVRRAQAQLDLSAVLAERARGGAGEAFMPQLSAAQASFYWNCRLAQHHLLAAHLPDIGVQELQERNRHLAKKHDFETIRAKAEMEALPLSPSTVENQTSSDGAAGSAPRSTPEPVVAAAWGTPVYWLASGQTSVPQLQLASQLHKHYRRAAMLSLLLVLLVFAVWLLSHVPRMLPLVRVLWPEQLVLLGGLGWLAAAGPGWPFALLFLIGVGGRVFLSCRWLADILRSGPDAQPPGAKSGVPAPGQ